jgi:hypothetical protein
MQNSPHPDVKNHKGNKKGIVPRQSMQNRKKMPNPLTQKPSSNHLAFYFLVSLQLSFFIR